MKNILYPINRRLVLLTGIYIFLSLGVYAQNQNMGIGTNTPNPRAVLDIVSPGNNQGILIPRLSASQRQNLSLSNTENGLFVFDTTDGKLYYWFSGAWKEVFGNFAGAQNNQILKFNSTTGRWELSEDIGVIYQAGEGISISSDNIITNTGDTNPDDDITTATEAEGDVEGLFPELNIRVDAVTTVKIAADAVTTAKIADGAITNPKIAVNAIATENIQDEAVTLDKLASNSVNTSKIINGSVTNEKLADNAVTTEKIANDAITNEKVLNRSLQVQKLAGQFERQNSLLITNSTNNPEWFQPGNDQVIVTTSGGLVFSEPRSNFATNTLPLNNIFIGNAAGFAQPQLVSGDGTLNVGGQLTLTNSPATRTNLGLGSIAVQNADNVSISGGAINATAIGGGTAAAGTFTTLNSNGLSTLNSLTVTGNTNLNGSNFFNGPTSVTGTNTFNTGTGQVTFGGNVNAEQGIDILGGLLRVNNAGDINFSVSSTGTTNIAGQTTITNGTASTSSATGALRVNGGVGIGQNLNVGGIARINGGGTAVDATGPTNGALIVDGGVGIAKSLYVGGTTNTAGIANTGTISTNNLNATGTANIQTLAVNGNTSIVGTLGAGATTLNSLNVTNNATIGGTLGVTGATTLTGLTTTALANLNSLRLGGSGESVSTIRNTVRPTGTADNVSLVTELAVRSAISGIGAENGLTNDGGIIKLGGALTQATTITTTVANTLTISGPGVLTIAGNIIANNGLTISGGPLNITNQAITQTGGGQVTFAGNVDANNGLDVSGANLTVGGGNFSVAPATGNTNIAGNLNIGGITTSNGIENTGAISSTSLSTTGNTSIGGNLQLATGVAVNTISDDITLGTSNSTLATQGAIKAYIDDATSNLSLPDAQVFVGNASNIATPRTITGDASINNTGVLTIADEAITTQKLADNAVTTAKIGDGQVTLDKLANNSVNSTKIIDGSIESIDLADGAVTEPKLATNAVSTIKIQDDAVTTAKIGDGQVTLDKLADNSVNSAKIIDGSIESIDLADGAVNEPKLATNAVSTIKIQDDAVTTAKIGDGQVTLDKLADNSVNSAKIIDGSIESIDLADGAVTEPKLATNAVSTIKIQDDAVTTAKILNANVTEAKIANNAVTNDKLDKENIPLSGFEAASADVDLGSNKLINVAVPTNNNDAATKIYVDNATSNLALSTGSIFIGVANIATAVTVSGDASIATTGVLTIADNAVNTQKLADNAVSTAKIGDAQVTLDKLADNSVNSAKIVDGSIESIDLADGAVTEPKLATNAVSTIKIQDDAISTAKIGDGQVTLDKLADNSVNSAKIVDGSIESIDLADGAVTEPKLATNAVSTIKIQDNAISTAKIGDAQVTLDKLANNSVNSAKIIDGSIESIDLADGAVTEPKLATNAVSTIKIQDDAVTTAKIGDGQVTLDKLATASVNSDKIVNGSIVDEDISPTAAIAGTKVNPNFGTQNITTSGNISATGSGVFSGDGSGLTNLNATELGSGTIPDARLSTNVTVAGNTFNGANQLVQLNGTGNLPALNAAALTNIDASNIASGTLSVDRIADASITGAKLSATVAGVGLSKDGSENLQVNVDGVTIEIASDALQVIDNSITSAKIAIGTIVNENISNTAAIAGSKVSPDFGTQNITTSGNITATGSGVFTGDGSGLTNLNASEIGSGTIPDARLSTNVTVAGNTFNGANQLVQLNGTGNLPALNAAALTNINADNISSGTLDIDRIGDGTIITAKIANQAINMDKIAEFSINEQRITTAAVATDKIRNLNVTTPKLADAAVTTIKISDGAVTGDKLENFGPGAGVIGGGSDYVNTIELDSKGRVVNATSGTPSDSRLKEDIQEMDNVSEKIKDLKGYNYYWKDKEKRGADLQYGVIAQELQAIFPEMVTEAKDGYLRVNYIALIPVLLQAIREQQALIADLSEALEKGNTEIADLKAAVAKQQKLYLLQEAALSQLASENQSMRSDMELIKDKLGLIEKAENK